MLGRLAVATLALASAPISFAGVDCVTRFDLFASSGDALDFSLALPLEGTFIGNWDARTNPGGTRTRPGLFGGSGNNPIAFTSTVMPSVDLAFPLDTPVFSFCVEDDGLGNATVTCVELDMVRGTPSPITIDVTITYPNFNTQQPTAVFPGVSGLTLPLPAGEITAARAVQTEAATGAIAPGEGGSLILTALVPAELSFEATVLGQPISVPPTPIVLPIVAELLPSLTGDYVAVLSLEIPTQEFELPLGGQVIENQPLPLPTVLPPGGTANLLVNGAFADGVVSFGLSADLNGSGATTGPTADLNGDCVVDGADLAILLGSWGSCSDCVADINDDGVVDGADLAILLGNWS